MRSVEPITEVSIDEGNSRKETTSDGTGEEQTFVGSM